MNQISVHFRKDIQQNIQDRYGNRYDPRFHSIPGEYDPENDPRFSDPRYQDPRNLPKYQNNRHRVPQDRYDSKYRYYERYILFLHLMLRSQEFCHSLYEDGRTNKRKLSQISDSLKDKKIGLEILITIRGMIPMILRHLEY